MPPGERATTSLPEEIQDYFWDYDASRLSWERHQHTIVLRLLQSGGLDAVTWLRSRMSDAQIREFLVRREGRGIDPRRLRFWGLILDIPRSKVDRWVEAARRNPWYRRTR